MRKGPGQIRWRDPLDACGKGGRFGSWCCQKHYRRHKRYGSVYKREWPHATVSCGYCGEAGHNRRTCGGD